MGFTHLRFISGETPALIAQPALVSALPSLVESQARKSPEIFTESKSPKKSTVAIAVLVLALAAALATIAVLTISLRNRTATQSDPIPPAALRTFWNQFASGPDVPRVICSNAAFVGRPETGMRYMDPTRDSRDVILDHYTGVGEVLAVHELDRVFAQLNHSIEVKRKEACLPWMMPKRTISSSLVLRQRI